MNSLPQELIDRISSYLDCNDLKNTLVLSHFFKYAAEEYSGGFSRYVLTEANADKFLDTFSGRRFRYLRTVEFATSVPALKSDGKEEESSRDTPEELNAIDIEFTRQIEFLLSTLKTLETNLDEVYRPGKLHLLIYTPTRTIDIEHFCIQRSYVSWRVHLLSPEKLPTLSLVRCLTIELADTSYYYDYPTPSLRKIDLRILVDLAHKLPNLEDLRCNIGGDEWFSGQEAFTDDMVEDMQVGDVFVANYIRHDWEGPRRDARHDFAKVIQEITLPSVCHAQLDFISPMHESDWIDQRLAMPNLVKPATYDPFSTSLRIFSYQLRTMQLRVVADETLFWPADGSTPYWPNLECISIMFHMVTPAGTWYFKGLPGVGAVEGYDITEECYPPFETTDEDDSADGDMFYYNWATHRVLALFRVEPNNNTIVSFLTAFAKAAALMPSLKKAALWCPLIFHPELEQYDGYDKEQVSKHADGELAWGLGYAKPDTIAFSEKDSAHMRQLWWKVGKWRPDPELHSIFQNVGRREHGEELAEYWTDEWSGDGLVERDTFEIFEDYMFK